jgi:TolB-like protein
VLDLQYMKVRAQTLLNSRGFSLGKSLIFLTLVCGTALAGASVKAQDTLDQRLDNLARQISNNLTENQKHTIAVIEFVDLKGNVTDFGRFLSEELITRLHQTKKFKVIERQQLNRIIAEQKLSLTGMVDPASAQKLGRVLGVDSIVFGSISDLVKSLKINARLISAETGEVFDTAAIEIEKDAAVSNLLGNSSTNGGGNQSQTQTPPQGQLRTWRIDSHFFTFDLRGCRLSGTSVLCDFIITNNDRDRRLGIGFGTKMFDDFGNEARPQSFQIADKLSGGYGVGETVVISGVATKARVVFEGVSPEATKMTLFQVSVYGDSGNFQIEYRNIPLREQPRADQNSESATSTAQSSESSRQTTLQVSPGQWIDSGIDVEPGMKLNVIVTGDLTAKSDNRAVSDVLSGVLRQRVNVPPSTRTIGAKAVIVKIHYRNGGDSKPLAVGATNTLIVENNEYGRLYFGIDSRYTNSNGSFTVTVKW